MEPGPISKRGTGAHGAVPGVGHENHDLIRFWLQLAHQHGLPAVTDHSLGGALAQMAACAWPELTGQVVTFQAPAINPKGMDNLKHFNAKHEKDGRAIVSQHVRFDNDVVEQAGNMLTPGFMHRFATPASPLMATLGTFAQPIAAVAGFGVGGVSGEWQMLRGRMNPWEALKMPFKGMATGFDLGYRLPRTGEHTTPAVRNELIARDPEAMKLFGKTKGVGAKVDYLASERVNNLGARPYERLREDVGGALATLLLKKPTQVIERDGGGVDTSNPQYVKAHQKLSEIARSETSRQKAIREMHAELESLLPRTSRFFGALSGRLGDIWQNWHPQEER